MSIGMEQAPPTTLLDLTRRERLPARVFSWRSESMNLLSPSTPPNLETSRYRRSNPRLDGAPWAWDVALESEPASDAMGIRFWGAAWQYDGNVYLASTEGRGVFQLNLSSLQAAITSRSSAPAIIRLVGPTMRTGPSDGFTCPTTDPFVPDNVRTAINEPVPTKPGEAQDTTDMADANSADAAGNTQNVGSPAVVGIVTAIAVLMLALVIVAAVVYRKDHVAEDAARSDASSEPSPKVVQSLKRDLSRVSEGMVLEHLIDQVEPTRRESIIIK